MNDGLKILGAIEPFSELSTDQLRQVHAITSVVDCKRGASIFLEGDDGAGFYVVMSSRVKVFKLSIEGREQILHILGPGEPFGEVAVFAGTSFPANAACIETSRLLFLPRAAFVDMISNNPSLAMKMLAVLSMRLRQFAGQVENLSLKEVPSRLASYLLVLMKEQPQEADMVTLPISKGQLAGLLGTIPETLSRILSRMSQAGLIKVSGATIHITDIKGLETVAGPGASIE
jgi:CRP-like cAMP-binding protein